MRLARWDRPLALGLGVLALACGGDSGGGTGPCTPGAATQLLKGGDQQSWYFSNPLPTAYSVTARDANSCPVPGVVVDWVAATGSGSVTPTQSTTGASGVATALHTLGPTDLVQTVTATATGAAPVTFTAHASAPHTSEAVDVRNNNFNPSSVVVKTGGSVTWTQTGVGHNVTFSPGPAPQDNIADATLATGTATERTRMFTTVGTYNYVCTNHSGMSGTVRVVN